MWNLKKVLKFNKRVNEDYICWYFLQNDFYPCRKNFSTFRNDFKAKVMCEFINLFRFLNYGVLLNYLSLFQLIKHLATSMLYEINVMAIFSKRRLSAQAHLKNHGFLFNRLKPRHPTIDIFLLYTGT